MKPDVRALTIYIKSFIRDMNTQFLCWLKSRMKTLWHKSSLFATHVTYIESLHNCCTSGDSKGSQRYNKDAKLHTATNLKFIIEIKHFSIGKSRMKSMLEDIKHSI